jgi:hypothetical protein
MRFDSSTAADKYHSTRGFSSVVNESHASKSLHGFVAVLSDEFETQDDLPEEDGKPKEQWVKVNTKLNVSNRGRIQRVRGGRLQRRVTVRTSPGQVYPCVQNKLLHLVVFKAFGGKIKHGETVDHIDRDKSNPSLHNLRAVPHSVQQANRAMPGRTASHITIPIEGRQINATDCAWEQFASLGAASRALTARLGKKVQSSNIGKVVRNELSQTSGWIFRRLSE